MELMDIKIKSVYNSTIKIIIELVPQCRRLVLVRKEVKWLILENIGTNQAPYMRALIAVVLGCDAMKGGVEGLVQPRCISL